LERHSDTTPSPPPLPPLPPLPLPGTADTATTINAPAAPAADATTRLPSWPPRTPTHRDPPNATLAGALDAEELLNAIARLGADDDALDEEAIQFLIRSVDANGDGEVGEGGPKVTGTPPTTAAVAPQSPPPCAKSPAPNATVTQVQREEFSAMTVAPSEEASQPHLVLNFDVRLP
jgi:hypothetical protein